MAKRKNVSGIVHDDNEHCLICNEVINEETEDWGLIYGSNTNESPRFLCNDCSTFVWSLRFNRGTGLTYSD